MLSLFLPLPNYSWLMQMDGADYHMLLSVLFLIYIFEVIYAVKEISLNKFKSTMGICALQKLKCNFHQPLAWAIQAEVVGNLSPAVT